MATDATSTSRELDALAAHLDGGTLDDERLRRLLLLIEGGRCGTRKQEARALAVRAIVARGGRFRCSGIDWVADGWRLRTEMPAP